MSDERTAMGWLGDLYGRLAEEVSRPGTKAGMVARCQGIAKEMRELLQWLGENPDAAWVRPEPVGGANDLIGRGRFPTILHVSRERDTDTSWWLMAQDDGVLNCDDGTAVGIYRLEGIGTVRVTRELITPRHK